MKILFDNVNFSATTGPNSFAKRLAMRLHGMGHVIADPDDYDIMLAFIEPSRMPKPGSRLVQRLDGIWFKPEDFDSKNVSIKACYDHADGVVWQSEFDKDTISAWWGDPKHGKVIGNGILPEVVTVSSAALIELRQKYDKVFVCSASWHPQKRLKANIELFQHLRKTCVDPSSALIIMGANPDHVVADPHVFYAGDVPHDVCSQVYAISDWMIHLAWLDHCPNVVVEALSQNTPVICTTNGGTWELVRNNGLLISEQARWNGQPTDYDSPPPIDVTQVKTLPDVGKLSIDHLHIDVVAKKYVEFFESLL